jgi:hypothetical protein
VRPLRMIGCAAAVLLVAPLFSSTASAQTATLVRVTRTTPVMEMPRGDSFVLGTVQPGMVLEVLDQSSRWLLVSATAGTPKVSWPRGWVLAAALELVDGQPTPLALGRRGDFMLRGFGQFGGALFSARDSFEAILESPFGTTYGLGGQVVFRNGLFVQADIDRFRKSGSRLVVSDNQVFRVAIPNTVTVTPIQATIGYRELHAKRIVGYGGAGLGWHVLQEQSSSFAADENTRKGHIGFHLSGGAEYRIAPFVWLAGEVQWASVPDGLGTPGIGPVFEESELGATRFRLKLIVGR